MGRSSEFLYGHGGEPTEDINLSDKVTDHPHYGETGEFHDPTTPLSKTCLYPGCGRLQNEHKSVYLPPTREGMEMYRAVMQGKKDSLRESKEHEARESHEEDVAMNSIHGTMPHFISGRGWSNEKGPQTKKQLRKHLVDDHDVWPEDAKEMEDPARSHARWHRNQEYGGETHHHHPDPIRRRPDDE